MMKSYLKTGIVAIVATLVTVFVLEKFQTNESEMTTSPKQVQNNNALFTQTISPLSSVMDFTSAAEKSIPAVVHVKVKVQTQMSGGSVFDYFFGPGQTQPRMQEGSGSGVIISSDGYIVTNNHVIDRSDNIEVVLNDKRTYDAKVIGADPQTDIALIKIEGNNFPVMKYGDSNELKIGEWVLAVGNPFSLSTTVTAGIVSAKARGLGIISGNNVMGIESFIQTDAAVNPGNSGGAMVNTNGELVGINTAIASPTGAYAGYAFAIPVNIVQKVVGDIIEFGEVQRALIGVQISDISAEMAKERDLNVLKGVYVEGLSENGAGQEAGLKVGDIITSVNGVTVNSVSELQEQVSLYRPGDKVAVDVIRNKGTKSFGLILRNMSGNTNVVKTADAILGAKFKAVDQSTKNALNLSYGVQISELKPGKFLKYDVAEGYIVTKINDQKIFTVADVQRAIETSDGALFVTGIYPNGRIAYYAINLKD